MTFFTDLGREVHARWKATSFDNARLAEIAVRVLEDTRPADQVSLESISDWCLESDQIPRQPFLDSNFGQPPLTVYADDRLYIEILVWLESTTSIHQHAFSGAFYVLGGSSLHSVYRFAEEARASHRLLVGALELEKVERLQVGDVHPIQAGPDYIHALFHLGYPSVTVVVRNYFEADKSPQHKFYRPGLALDEHTTNPVQKRQEQVLGMLHRIGDPGFEPRVRAWMERADAESAVRMLLKLYKGGHLTSELGADLVDAVEARHGAVGRMLRPVLHEEQRQRRLMSMRGAVTDPGHRLLLALMLTDPGREAALEVIADAYPGSSPAMQAMKWLPEINAVSQTPLAMDDLQRLLAA